MSAGVELIRAVEANGGRFRIDGESLVIAPGEAAAPLIDELRQHKAELLAELASVRPCLPVSGFSHGTRRSRQSNCRSVQPSRTLTFSSARHCGSWRLD